MVDSSMPMDRYEMKVRSLANQTLASTLTGVGFFSEIVSYLFAAPTAVLPSSGEGFWKADPSPSKS